MCSNPRLTLGPRFPVQEWPQLQKRHRYFGGVGRQLRLGRVYSNVMVGGGGSSPTLLGAWRGCVSTPHFERKKIKKCQEENILEIEESRNSRIFQWRHVKAHWVMVSSCPERGLCPEDRTGTSVWAAILEMLVFMGYREDRL